MSPWLIVLIAGLMETGWALGLKYSDGFTKPVPSVLTVLGAVASFWLLSIAMKDLPVGTAYAVWTGIGAAGTFVLGILLFGEQSSMLRWLGAAMIIGGVIILKVGN